MNRFEEITGNPMVWFILSLVTIGLGVYLFEDADADDKYMASIATLFVSLGTAGIMRVRTPRKGRRGDDD